MTRLLATLSWAFIFLGSTLASAYDIDGPYRVQEVNQNTIRCTYSSWPDGGGMIEYIVEISLEDCSVKKIDSREYTIAILPEGNLTLVSQI